MGTRLLVAMLAAAAARGDPRDSSSVEETMASLQEMMNDMSAGDRRGNFPKMDLKDQKEAPQYKYQLGDKVVTTEDIMFKRAKGTSAKKLDKFSVCTVTAVPGDSEGSVAEVEVDKKKTSFDPTATQIIPLHVHEANLAKEAAERDANTDWAELVRGLVLQHRPERAPKLPKFLAAHEGREKALYHRLRSEFKLDDGPTEDES
eukprot:TRINITY_DN6290_c0_g1_i1.p2 TRINITY_DN6290_c0_g1~~TRINITY_DN6290_c0_g1_i1.p2  ORF type:complete len:203 (+),score=64.39 TRINITY_DN6290_c0_g1_i1:185-793(+)